MNVKNVFRPIWEMELVISGAVILGLFQLPQLADQAFHAFTPHLAFNTFFIHFMAYYIAKLSINSLIGAFMLHFVVRSLWVAIMGLREVFPGEVDLDQTDFGPVSKRIIQIKGVNLTGLQRRLDHFASMIFSMLFLMIVMLVMMALYAGACIASALILPKLGVSGSFFKLFLVSFGVIYGSTTILTCAGGMLDKWMKADETRVDRYPRLARLTYFCLLVAQYMFFGFVTQPVVVVLRTKISASKFTTYTMIAFGIIVSSFLIGMKLETMQFDSYVFMPYESAPQSVNTACYDSLRQPGDSIEVPSIQSDVIHSDDGPIRLFLPYHVLHNNRLLEDLCPDLEPLHADGWYDSSFYKEIPTQERLMKVDNALNCAKQLYTVSVDGQMLSELNLLFTRHHMTNKGGFLLYIPIQDFQPGQHVIHIQMKKQRKKECENKETYIPFYLTPA